MLLIAFQLPASAVLPIQQLHRGAPANADPMMHMARAFFVVALLLLAATGSGMLCFRSMNSEELLSRAKQYSGKSQYKLAEKCLTMAMERGPGDLARQVHLELGRVYKARGKFDKARDSIWQALQAQFDAEAWLEFQDLYNREGRLEQLYIDIGALYKRNSILENNPQLLDNAENFYHQALELKPDSSMAHAHLFELYSSIPRKQDDEKALHHLELAVKYNSSDARLAYQLGTLYYHKPDLLRAEEALDIAVKADPNFHQAAVNRFYIRKRIAKWDDFDRSLEEIVKFTREEMATIDRADLSDDDLRKLPEEVWSPALHPYQAISYGIDDELKRDLTRYYGRMERLRALNLGLSVYRHAAKDYRHVWNEHFEQLLNSEIDPRAENDLSTRPAIRRRLRIGYLSSDFRHKATTFLIQKMYRFHRREYFDVHCFALRPDDGSVWRRQIMTECEHFVEFDGVDIPTMVKKIHDVYKIDVLIDMDGYCNEGMRRSQVMAVQPAPLQLHLLVYPGTLGADWIQYLVADPFTAPPEYQHLYAPEKLLYMPHNYNVNSYRHLRVSSLAEHGSEDSAASQAGHTLSQFLSHVQSDQIFTRKDFGLPKDKFVFASFHAIYKLDPDQWTTWMSILKRAPNSVLWLLRFPTASEPNLIREAQRRGIAKSRLVFSDYLGDPELNLKRLQLADLVLDTHEYNGHTTCSDALFAGVPVVSRPAAQFASRVCAMMITQLGLRDRLVASTPKQFEDIAVQMYKEPTTLAELRAHVEDARFTSEIFDLRRWMRNFEKGLLQIWKRYISGALPEHTYIRDAYDEHTKREEEKTEL